MDDVGIKNKFRILSVNNDSTKIQFISSLEHVTLPFYALQFHPEKNLYEWIRGKKIPHGKDSTIIAQYFADFFVNEGIDFLKYFYFLFLKLRINLN